MFEHVARHNDRFYVRKHTMLGARFWDPRDGYWWSIIPMQDISFSTAEEALETYRGWTNAREDDPLKPPKMVFDRWA